MADSPYSEMLGSDSKKDVDIEDMVGSQSAEASYDEMLGFKSVAKPAMSVMPPTEESGDSESTRKFYSTTAISPPIQGLFPAVVTPALTSYLGMNFPTLAPQPEGGFNEVGVPLDAKGKPYTDVGKPLTTALPRPPGPTTISQDNTKPNFIRRAIGKLGDIFGVDVAPKLSESARAQATVQMMADEEGVPLHEYRQSPELIEKAASSFVSMASFNMMPAIRETMTGEVDFESTDLLGYVGTALGSLGGLIFGPMKAAEAIISPVIKYLPRATQEGKVATRILKAALHDAVVLGPAMGLASLGEAAKSVTFSQASEHIWEGTKSGALTGAVFGMAKGIFPKEGIEKGARLIAGLVGLNALRAHESGGNPFTNRPVGEVLFDIGLDALFLYKGLPKGEYAHVTDTIDNLAKDAAKTKQEADIIDTLPDEALRKAQANINEAKNTQNKLKAEELAKRVSEDIEIVEEIGRQAEEIAKAKIRPVQDSELELPKIKDEVVDPLLFELESKRAEIKAEGIKRNEEVKKQADDILKGIDEKPKSKPRKRKEVPLKEVKSEADEIFDFAERPELKRKRKFNVEEHIVAPGEPINIPATWHDAAFRTTIMRDADGNLHMGRGGSYDTILMEGNVAGAKSGAIPPGTTLYVLDTGGEGTVAQTRQLRIYRAESESKKVGPKQIPEKITEVDRATGTDVPDLKGERSPFYQDAKDTEKWKAIYSDPANAKRIANSPDLTVQKLINDVNRWYKGDDTIDIEATRNLLSSIKIAVDTTVVREAFGNNSVDILNFKEMVSDAATWARGLDRLNIEQTKVTELITKPVRDFSSKLRSDVSDMTADALKKVNSYNKWKFEVDDRVVGSVKGKAYKITGRTWSKRGGYGYTYESVDGAETGVFSIDRGANKSLTKMGSPKVVRRRPSQNQLNSMVPLDEIPDVVKDIWDKSKILFKDIYRNKEVWEKTGYWVGKDGIWRYELPPGTIKPEFLDSLKETESFEAVSKWTGKLTDVLDDPRLFKGAPGLKGAKLVLDRNLKEYEGTFDSKTNTIEIKYPDDKESLYHEINHAVMYYVGSEFRGTSVKNQLVKSVHEFLDDIKAVAGSPEIVKEVEVVRSRYLGTGKPDFSATQVVNDLKRSIGHSISENYIEGMAKEFINVARARKNYLSDQGEMESRLVEKRMDLTDKQRKETPPWETLDKMLVDEGIDIPSFKEGLALEFGDKSVKLKGRTGNELYSNLPLDKVGNLAKELAIKVEDIFRNKPKMTIDDLMNIVRAYPNRAIDTAADLLMDQGMKREDIKTVANARWLKRQALKGEGTTLYANAPVDEVIKQVKAITKFASGFMKEFKHSIEYKKFDVGYAAKQLKSDVVRATSDQQETLLKYVRKNYPKEAQKIIDRQRSAAAGKGYGEILYNQASKEIYGGKSKEMIDAINAYILARRFKDIYKYTPESKYKHRAGYGADEANNLVEIVDMLKDAPDGVWKLYNQKIPELKEIFGNLTREQLGEVVRSAETYFEWSRKIVDDLVAAGLKSAKEGELLKAHDFRKFKSVRIEKLYDFGYKTNLGGETISSTNSGVESLGWGSTKIIEPDGRIPLHEMFMRSQGSIANQEAKIEWKRLAGKYPDNGFVSQQQKPGWSPMPYFEEGVRKNLYFHPDAVKYMVTRSHDISSRLLQVLRLGTLSPITRALAVGLSPAWSTFVGLPMDVIHTLWTAKTFELVKDADGNVTKSVPKKLYSAFNPISPLKLAKDMISTLPDVYTRGEIFKDYMRYGGSMPFLAMRQGRYLKGAKPPGNWAKFVDLWSHHGVSMETWVRVATAERVIKNRARENNISYEEARKNKDIMYEAVHAARDRMDYNQGGWMIKAADHAGMIFLNAGVLGTRTFWRSATENPVDFTFRSMKLGTIASGIVATGWLLYPEIMKDIPKEGNEKNVTFPLFPDYINFEDENGETRHFYAKVRMDPGAAFQYKFYEALTKTYLYDKGLIDEEPDYMDLVKNLKQLGPIGVSLPPLVQTGYDYATNYSWWKGRSMYNELGGRTLPWPLSQHEGMQDPNVSQIAKDIGSVTKLSPKRLQESASNVIPRNNEFVYLFGKAYEEAFSDIPKEVRKQHWLMTLAEFPGFNRIIGVTRPGYKISSAGESAANEENAERVVRNGKMDFITENYYWKGYGSELDVDSYIDSFEEKHIRDSLERRRSFIEKVRDLPNRSAWLSKFHQTPELKAKHFNEVYTLQTPESEFVLDELIDAGYIGSDSLDRFFDEMEKIRLAGPSLE